MNLEQVEKKGNVEKVHARVSRGDIQSTLDKEMKKTQKNAQIAGFRKGKAPMRLLFPPEHVEALKEKTAWDLLEASLYEERKEGSLQDLIYPPVINDASQEESGDYEFVITLYRKPEITLPDLSSVVIRRHPIKAEHVDESVEKRLNEILEEHAVLSPSEKAADWGDQVTLTYRVFNADNRLLYSSDSISYRMDEADHNPLIKGALGRSKEEQFELNRKFEKDGRVRDYRYEVRIEEIQERERLPLDDQLPKELGFEFESLREMKDSWHQEIMDNVISSYRKYYLSQLTVKELVEQSQMEDSEEAAEYIAKETIKDLKPEDLESYMKELKLEDQAEANDVYKAHLLSIWKERYVIEKYMESHHMTLEEEEVDGFLEERGAQIGLKGEVLKKFYQNQNQMDSLMEQLKKQKVGISLVDLVQWEDVEEDSKEDDEIVEAEFAGYEDVDDEDFDAVDLAEDDFDDEEEIDEEELEEDLDEEDLDEDVDLDDDEEWIEEDQEKWPDDQEVIRVLEEDIDEENLDEGNLDEGNLDEETVEEQPLEEDQKKPMEE